MKTHLVEWLTVQFLLVVLTRNFVYFQVTERIENKVGKLINARGFSLNKYKTLLEIEIAKACYLKWKRMNILLFKYFYINKLMLNIFIVLVYFLYSL